jgi:Amino acid permease
VDVGPVSRILRCGRGWVSVTGWCWRCLRLIGHPTFTAHVQRVTSSTGREIVLDRRMTMTGSPLMADDRPAEGVHGVSKRQQPGADRRESVAQLCWRELRESKPVEEVISASASNTRWLTRRHLVVASLAAVIGAGISDNARTALHDYGGWNTVLGLAVAAVASLAAALCFAELASTIPVSGSTYAYTAFNQAFAWIVGWILLAEYSVGAFVIALSWSQFVTHQPDGSLGWAFVLIAICSLGLALTGLKRGWLVLAILVAASVTVKVGLMLVTTVAGFTEDQFVLVRSSVQLPKVGPAFGMLYFSFIGFDAPSTAAEDSRYPQRDLARSILVSLAIVSVLYLAFTMSGGFSSKLGRQATEWGVLLGLPSGVLVLVYAQGRILRAVWRDGLLWSGSRPDRKKPDKKWRWEPFWAGGTSIIVNIQP